MTSHHFMYPKVTPIARPQQPVAIAATSAPSPVAAHRAI